MALTTPFAQNGDKKTIPENTTGDGSLSYETGFGGFYALPPEEGGLYIDRAQFNQLMYDTTSQVLTNKGNITTIQGDLATAQSNITTLQQKTSSLENSVSNINSTINQVISSDVTPIGVYKTVKNKTIGTNGDFKTIQEAFTYAQTHQKQALNQELTLTLLEDLNHPRLYLRGAWYPHLTIDCNNFVLADNLKIDLSCFKIINLKLNNRIATVSSIIWITGNTNINYQTNDYASGAITALSNSLINLNGNINLSSSIPNRTGITAHGNGIISLDGDSTVTQTSGARCFNVIDGGIIQLGNGINLTGVTVPKANQAPNTITQNGIIFGNYSL